MRIPPHFLNSILLLAVFLSIYPYVYNPKLFTGGDNAAYYALAQGLAHGEGYVNYHLSSMAAANHFPPGYPVILSVFLFFTDGSIELTNYVSGLFYAFCIVLTYLLAFRLTGQRIFATLVTLFVLLNRHLFEYATITMSEVPFCFFLLLTIYLFLKTVDANRNWKSWQFWLLIVCAIMTVYIRSQGIVLIGSMVLFLALKKHYATAAIMLGICLLALAPWQIRDQQLGGSAYTRQLLSVNPYDISQGKMTMSDWPKRITKNAKRYLSEEIPGSLAPGLTTKADPFGTVLQPPGSYGFIGVGMILLCIVGVWKIRKYRWFFLPFFCGSFLVLFLWPEVWTGVRFILPIVPLLCLFGFIGLWHLLRMVFRKLPEGVFQGNYAYSMLPLCLIHFAPLKELHERAQMPYTPNWHNFFELAEWAETNLPEGSVICSRKPELFYVLSHKQSSGFLRSEEEDLFLADLRKNKVTHVVVEQLGSPQTNQFLVPFIRNNPQKFELVHSIGVNGKQVVGGTWLYRFHDAYGYHGGYKDGKKHGKGYLTGPGGMHLNGTWKNNQLNGPGELRTPKGLIYRGNWKNDLKNGSFHIMDVHTGNQYLSEWRNDTLIPEGQLPGSNQQKVKKIQL